MSGSKFLTPEKIDINLLSGNKLNFPIERLLERSINSFDSREWAYITPHKPPIRSHELEMYSEKSKHGISTNYHDLDVLLKGAWANPAQKIDFSYEKNSFKMMPSSSLLSTESQLFRQKTSIRSKIDEIISYSTPIKQIKISIIGKQDVQIQTSDLELADSLINSKDYTDHKPCNCKKSKCIKLYCDCFKSGSYCTKECFCVDCMNHPQYEHLLKHLEEKNVKRQTKQLEKGTSVFCKCLKSACVKMYCECYRKGVQCTDNCFCKLCNNK